MRLINSRNIDRSLFLYGSLTAIVLTVSALLNLNNLDGLLATLLFLPVTLYFLSEIFQKANQASHQLINHGQPKEHRYFAHFTFATFFNQTDISFLITLILLALAISLILFRLSLKLIK